MVDQLAPAIATLGTLGTPDVVTLDVVIQRTRLEQRCQYCQLSRPTGHLVHGPGVTHMLPATTPT